MGGTDVPQIAVRASVLRVGGAAAPIRWQRGGLKVGHRRNALVRHEAATPKIFSRAHQDLFPPS
jgi:hypothetical protein